MTSSARAASAAPYSLSPGVTAASGSPTAADALVEAARAAERHGAREEARALYERALYLLRGPDQAKLASALLRWVARSHQVDANFDAALDCLEAALAVAEASGCAAEVGHALNVQASVRVQQGRLDEAERLYQEARACALRAGDARLSAMTAQNLGVIANVHGDVRQAVGHYQASLAEYRALGLARDVSVALNNLGKAYTQLERWAEAEAAYGEAVEICTVLGDLSTLITLHINVAELWLARGDYERAQQSCDRAAALARETGDGHAEGEAEKVYGVVARETGDHEAAERFLAHAEQIAEERQHMLLLADVVRERAALHARQGRNRDTLQCLNRAHRLYSQLRARRALAAIDRETTRLEHDFLEVVQRWGASIESKDQYTQGHCERVADVACALAAKAGLDGPSLFWFRIGALLHDVGKLVIPTDVLNKTGRLTDEEWAIVKRHPIAGVEMLAEIDFPWDVRPIVESHHERWDGAGYPHGLRGEAIPLEARILCIADVYDALTSDRSYKAAFGHEDAMQVMRLDVGRVFDPALFPLFEEVMRVPPPPRAAPAPPQAAPPPPAAAGDRDDLTGALMRRPFLDAAALALAERGDAPVALLVIDVDHFKLVNDTFGHLQGDDVLRAVADALAGAGPGALVGRYAGDEFVVLLPGASAEGGREVAERLRVAVERRKCAVRDRPGATVGVSLSIGVAAAPDHGADTEQLFAAADQALYEAKRQGRNRAAVARDGAAPPRQAQLQFDRFVGRTQELRRLTRLLETSAGGELAVASIVGEAGVGKSTLLRQLGPEVRLRGGALVLGRCLEADVKPPYGPWADVLAALRALNLVSERPWRELQRLVPALAPADPARPPADAAANKYALYDELAEYLRLAAAARPIVVVLDDMQWADAATWDALEHLLPQLERDRVLICLTIRAEDARGEVVGRRRRLSRDERFHEIALSRLTRAELRELLAAAFHDDAAAENLLDFLYRQTEGNPLFVVQVLRTLLDEGAVWHTGERWEVRPVAELRLPVAVSELIARRLDRLSPEARGLLTVAAAVGREFDVDVVVAAGGATEDEVLDAIDEGVAAAVLEPNGSHDGDRFAFAHTLLVEAVRRTTNPRRVRRIHEKVAAALEARTPDAVGEIAAHYDQAGVPAKAYHYALLAGDRAAAVYANDEATAFLGMAVRHAETPRRAAEARLRLARVAEAAGRYGEALALGEELLAWFGDAAAGHAADGDAADGDAALAMSVRRARERLRVLQGQPPRQTLRACHALLGEAEAAGLEAERVALMTMVSQAHTRLSEWEEAECVAREGVLLAEAVGEPRLLADAVTRLGNTLLETRPRDAVDMYDRGLEIFSAAGDRHGQTRCHINRGIAWMRVGDAAEAERAFVQALEVGRSAHAPDLAGLASLNAGVLSQRLGHYDEAQARLTEALRLFRAVRNEPHRLGTLYNMAHLARERGDAAAALTLYGDAALLASDIGQTDVQAGALAGLGLAALALGRADAAADAARDMAALLADREGRWFQGREMVELFGVRAALDAGDADAAEARFDASLAMAAAHDRYGAAYLVAECAGPLAAAGRERVWAAVTRYAPVADALGYVALAARFTALVGGRASATTAAAAGGS